ncbi:MAG: carboxypeptidase regulatory-like domain-containing protein [Bacteroidales bacterium]|nr:carboxypeptidase regulatory-like domain-containing protein [Bacteroidales bacterium]
MTNILMRTLISLFVAFAVIGSIHASEPFNGIVVDMDGHPIKGAKIYVHNPKKNVKSDKKGEFVLTDVTSTDTLHVKVKKKVYEVPVNGSKGKRIIVGDISTTGIEDFEEKNVRKESVRERGYLGRSNNLYRRNRRH